jgi:ectoine hydroxylase-related dioxygenase (phytanoyl-CoA dioxygenase family)
MLPFKATLFLKTGKGNWLVSWHQDSALPVTKNFSRNGWGPFATKAGRTFAHAPSTALRKILAFRIHLDDSNFKNGPLRVIPGSHARRIQDEDAFRSTISATKEVVCSVGKGGVIAMRPLLIHASSKSINDLPRRVLHIEYAGSLEIEPGIKLAIA